jgi:hypothetical protein
MKKLHYLGYPLWFFTAYLSLKLVWLLYFWYNDITILYKILLLFFTALTWLIGFYKIPLAFILLVDRNHKKFNQITTGYSIIGLIGLLLSYFYNIEIQLSIVTGSNLKIAISSSFLFFWVIMLFNGFVLMPKSRRI